MPSSGVDPALFTRISIGPPSACVACSTALTTASGTDASAGTATTRRPLARAISSAACRSVSSVRATIATSQPSRASSSATARPMPRLAPVTRALLPLMPRSMSVRPDAGALHDGGPAVHFGLQHLGELIGRADRDVPPLRNKVVRDLRHAHHL